MSKITYEDNKNTAVLAISSSAWNNTNACNDVLHMMLKLGVMTSVTENQSVICNKEKCWVEKGCLLTFGCITKKELGTKVWPELQQKYGISCAHLHVPGVYRGCILNYLPESKCGVPTPHAGVGTPH